MKMKVLSIVASMLLVAGIIGGATFASFSSSGNLTASTFSAGTLTMDMSSDATQTANWVSPANWAPGEAVTSTINFNNSGSIDAHHIYFGFKDVTNTDPRIDSSNLLNAIIVTDLHESFKNTNGTTTATTGNQAANLAAQVGNHDGILTLKEFSDFYQGTYGYYTWDDQSGDGVVLAAGSKADYALTFTLTFDPNAGNEYQADTAGFTFIASATQNSPTEGLVALHPAAIQ